MVQQVQDHPINFEGRGFTVQNSGDYRPGEFKRLHNMELLDGRITGRRDIFGLAPNSNALTESTKAKFIGSFNDFAVYSGPNCQYAVNFDGTMEPMWNPNLLGSSSANYFERLVGFFKYNHVNYWINYFQRENTVDPLDSSVGLQLLFQPDTITDVPGDYTYGGMSDNGNQIELFANEADANEAARYTSFQFRNAFMHRDRLWVVLKDRVHFSADFDPTLFEVSDGGGFLGLAPGTNINYAFGLGDEIYVLCDDSIYVFNYSIDPNDETDITSERITNDFGAQHGCAFRNVPYVINKEGIYQINNQYLTKLMDNKFDTGDNDYDLQKLTPFREYLIVSKSHLKQEFPMEGISAYKTNYARNPNFQYTTKAPPIVSRLEYSVEPIMDTLLSKEWVGTYAGTTLKDIYISDTGVLYAMYHTPGSSGFVHINKADIVFDANGNITGLTGTVIYFGRVMANEVLFLEVNGLVKAGGYLYVLGRRATASSKYVHVVIAIADGAATTTAIVNLHGEVISWDYVNISGVYSIGYDRINNRIMTVNGSSTKGNIRVMNPGSIAATPTYYAISEQIWGLRDLGKLCDKMWTMTKFGTPGIVMKSKDKVYFFPLRTAASVTAFDETLNLETHATLGKGTFKSPTVSLDAPGIPSAIACQGKTDNFYFSLDSKFYRSSPFVFAPTAKYVMVFYKGTNGEWVSFRKESRIVSEQTRWRIQPVELPSNISAYSVFVSTNQTNWYEAQHEVATPTPYHWDGINTPSGVTPVGLSGLPIPLTTPQYTDPATNIPEKFGYDVDTFYNPFHDEINGTRFYQDGGVLKVFNIRDQQLNGNSGYTVMSDGFLTEPVYGRIPIEAGKVYTVSAQVRLSHDSSRQFKSKLLGLHYDGAGTPGIDQIEILSDIQPLVSTSWQTVSWTFLCLTTGTFSYYVTLECANDVIWDDSKFDNSFQIKERLFEVGSSRGMYFDGDASGVPNVVFYWDEVGEEWSTSSSSYLSSTDRNLTYPFYDKSRAENAGNKYHTNVVFINMDAGSIHSVGIDDIPNVYEDKIIDVNYNGETGRATNYPSLFFLGVRPDELNLPFGMGYEISNRPTDRLYESSSYYPESIMPIYLMEIDSVSPDGTEYVIKKFRNLEIMGKFPRNFMRLYVGYDDRPYDDLASSFTDPSTSKTFPVGDKLVDGSARPHFPHQIGLNQRARSISIKATNLISNVSELQHTQYDKFEISTMRLLWSPTQRASGKRSNL